MGLIKRQRKSKQKERKEISTRKESSNHKIRKGIICFRSFIRLNFHFARSAGKIGNQTATL